MVGLNRQEEVALAEAFHVTETQVWVCEPLECKYILHSSFSFLISVLRITSGLIMSGLGIWYYLFLPHFCLVLGPFSAFSTLLLHSHSFKALF